MRSGQSELLSPQELSFVGQKVPVRVLLHASGLAGQQATVRLVDEQEKVLGKKTATLTIGKPVELQFDVDRDRSGVFRSEVRADPLPGEVTTVDNQATFLLRVIDEASRDAVAGRQALLGHEILAPHVASDRSIELVSVVRLAEGRFLQPTLNVRWRLNRQARRRPLRRRRLLTESGYSCRTRVRAECRQAGRLARDSPRSGRRIGRFSPTVRNCCPIAVAWPSIRWSSWAAMPMAIFPTTPWVK